MKKTLLVVIGIALLFLAVGGSVVGHQVTKTDTFCSSCHAYEKASWDFSPHPHVGCLDCHTGGFVRDKTQGARKVWLVFTGQIDPHHAKLSSYPDKTMNNCVGCHFSDEAVEAFPTFVGRHAEYLQAGQFCIACHEPGHRLDIRDAKYSSATRREHMTR